MIVTPQRRIMLTETQHGRLEILILGAPEAVGIEHAAILRNLESWPGWQNVGTIVMGSQSIGLRADVSQRATSLDPIVEFHAMRFATPRWLANVKWQGALGLW